MEARLLEVAPVLTGWINVSRGSILLSSNETMERHVEDHGDGVAVLPYDPHRRVALLISQPRLPVLLAGEPPVLEVIAGRLDGASPEDRIAVEAMEEGGVELGELELFVHAWSMPSISTEKLHLYLAQYTRASLVSPGGGRRDEHEEITVHELSLDHLAEAAACGDLTDAKTLILVQALQLKHPHLFASVTLKKKFDADHPLRRPGRGQAASIDSAF